MRDHQQLLLVVFLATVAVLAPHRLEAQGFDPGYDINKTWADFNGDGLADYCRLVGNPTSASLDASTEPGQEAIQCAISGQDGGFLADHLRWFRWGSPLSRGWVDINGDKRIDYCTTVSTTVRNQGRISCALGGTDGWIDIVQFPTNGITEIGYDGGRRWLDADRDGKTDYCYLLDNPPNVRGQCRKGPTFDQVIDANFLPIPDYLQAQTPKTSRHSVGRIDGVPELKFDSSGLAYRSTWWEVFGDIYMPGDILETALAVAVSCASDAARVAGLAVILGSPAVGWPAFYTAFEACLSLSAQDYVNQIRITLSVEKRETQWMRFFSSGTFSSSTLALSDVPIKAQSIKGNDMGVTFREPKRRP